MHPLETQTWEVNTRLVESLQRLGRDIDGPAGRIDVLPQLPHLGEMAL
jgi:hypothetical protein